MSIVTKSTLPTLAARLGKVHVMLVDDDVEMLELLRGLMLQLGFGRITSATDASSAIALLRAKKPAPDIDLIITDWNMQPLDGLELIRFVRTAGDSPNPYMPIIVLSGRGEWADVEKARDAGFSEYLIKPFNVKSLCERILLCVENPRAFVSTDTYKGPSRRRRDSGQLPPGVETDRRQRNVENNLPGKALKSKIGFDISMRQIFTKEHIDKAQGFLENRADHYRERAIRDVGELLHTLRNAQQTGNLETYRSKISRLAFSLKSHAGTFGYDLGTQVAKSLQTLCAAPSQAPAAELVVIAKHIDTLRIVFTQNIRGSGGETGEELMRSLNALTQKYKQKQILADSDG